MNLAVHAAVLAVHVVKQSGRTEKVIEGGIEDCPVTGAWGFDFDAREIRVPFCLGSAANFFKIPVGNFGGDVLAGSFFAYARDSGLYRDGFPFVG